MTDEERNEQAEERSEETEEREDASTESGDESTGDDDGNDPGDERDDDDASAESGDDSGRTVRDVMTSDPVTVEPSATVEEAAQKMKESDAGAVLIVDGDELKGIVTDRDIAVDAVAEGEGGDAKVEDVASTDPATVSPDDEIDKAIETMREQKVRRLPVVEDGKPVGVVSIGDLAAEADESSVLGDLAGAEANN
jgi:CBS domain-containing protein